MTDDSRKALIVATAAAALAAGVYAFINRRWLSASLTQTYNKIMTGKYFDLPQLTASATATARGIDNTPTADAAAWLGKLITKLDEVRERFGSAIVVSSGYRCPALNSAVGGVSTSQHVKGQAADLVPASGNGADVGGIFLAALAVGGYDQLIYEHNKRKGTRWVHISVSSSPKGQALAYDGTRYYSLANPATDYLQYA